MGGERHLVSADATSSTDHTHTPHTPLCSDRIQGGQIHTPSQQHEGGESAAAREGGTDTHLPRRGWALLATMPQRTPKINVRSLDAETVRLRGVAWEGRRKRARFALPQPEI